MENRNSEVKFEQHGPIFVAPEIIEREPKQPNELTIKTIERLATQEDEIAPIMPILPPDMQVQELVQDGIKVSTDELVEAMHEEDVSNSKGLGAKAIRAVMKMERECGDDMHKLSTMVQDASDTAIYNLFGRVRDNMSEGK